MFFGFPRMLSGGQARHPKPALRAFAESQSGAVTVDFVPLVCAVIGLGVAVVSFFGATLTSPTDSLAAMLDDINVAPEPGAGFGLSKPSLSPLPEIENAPQSTPASTPASANPSSTVPPVAAVSPSTGSGTTGTSGTTTGTTKTKVNVVELTIGGTVMRTTTAPQSIPDNGEDENGQASEDPTDGILGAEDLDGDGVPDNAEQTTDGSAVQPAVMGAG